jgi:multidrug efflux pump subunit AcrA (membrane-fusion protein)
MAAICSEQIVVSEHTKLIPPPEPGAVKAVGVQDGDRVHAGQVLVELDAIKTGKRRDRVLAEPY